MTTISHDLTPDSYTQITAGESSGSVLHLTGAQIKYTQSDAQPDNDAPLSKYTRKGEDFVYWKMPAGVFLWAIGEGTVTTSPAEE
jgi:hypothetical protein